MKEGWSYKKLGEVCEVTDYVANGSFATLKQNVTYYNEPNYAILVRLADYSSNFDKDKFVYVDEHSYKFLSKSSLYGGEIIMSNVGSIGKCFLCPTLGEYMTIGPNSLLIRTPNNLFYLYYFKSNIFQKELMSITNSTTLSKFNKTQLKTLYIPVPPLSEQRSIVTRLDAAFSHIDALKANAEKQLNEARKLFQAELTECMKPKEGWEEKTLGEIATDMYRGSGIKRDQVTQDGTPCVRYGEIYTTYDIGFEQCVSHTKEEYIASPKYFEHGDLLFAITGESVEDIGKTIAYLGNEKCLLGGDIICMKHRQNPKFLSYALATEDAIRQKGLGKTKLKVVHTNAPAIKSIKIPLSPLDSQQAIVTRLDTLSSQVRNLEENCRKTLAECDALKQAMLREVFE